MTKDEQTNYLSLLVTRYFRGYTKRNQVQSLETPYGIGFRLVWKALLSRLGMLKGGVFL